MSDQNTRAPVECCPICDWPFAESAEKGCVPGDCSYRPDEPTEQERIRKRRADLARAHIVSSQAGEDRIPMCKWCPSRLACQEYGCRNAIAPYPASGGMGDLADELTKWVEGYALKVCPEGCLPLPAQEREINLFARIVIALRTAAQSAEVRERTIEEWCPAKTAPKDGKPFLAFFPDGDFTPETGIDVIWWEPSEQRFLIGGSPIIWKFSHWRSLPVPPRLLARAGVKPVAATDPDAWMREDGSAATVNPMIAGGWKGQGITVVPLYASPPAPALDARKEK